MLQIMLQQHTNVYVKIWASNWSKVSNEKKRKKDGRGLNQNQGVVGPIFFFFFCTFIYYYFFSWGNNCAVSLVLKNMRTLKKIM